MRKRKSITGIRRRPKKISAAQLIERRPGIASSDDENSSHGSTSPKAQRGRNSSSRQSSPKQRPKQHIHRQRQLCASYQSSVKHISQSTIQSKWKVLDGAAQSVVETLLQDIALQTLAKQADDNGRVKAQDAVNFVTRSLCKRIPKMPFPPNAAEEQFDHNALAKHNREFQRQLTDIAKSLAAAKFELEGEQDSLQTEKEELARIQGLFELRSKTGDVDQVPFSGRVGQPQDMPAAIGLV